MMRSRWNIVANKLPTLNMVPVYTQEGSIWSIVVSTEVLSIYIFSLTQKVFLVQWLCQGPVQLCARQDTDFAQ